MAGPGGGPPRRSHTKSRKGCETCKRRHIRCDENFPQCRNCTKHNCRCPYMDMMGIFPTNLERSISPERADLMWTPKIEADIIHWQQTGIFPFPDLFSCPATFPQHFSFEDLRLLYHIASVSAELGHYDSNKFTIWTHQVPIFLKIGINHVFVMHALLALAATHLAWLTKCGLTASIAYEHRGTAMSGLHEAIGSFSRKNSDAVLAASLLLSWQESGWRGWTQLMHGTSSVIDAMQPWKEYSQFGDFIAEQGTFPTAPPSPIPGVKNGQPQKKDLEALQEAYLQLQEVEAHFGEKEIIFRDAIRKLMEFLQGVREVSSNHTSAQLFEMLDPLRAWLFWQPVIFLQQTRGSPLALLTIAHYYAVALVVEPLFPEVGAAYFGSLTLKPIEEIACKLISSSTHQSSGATMSMALNLMKYPLEMVSNFKNRMGWIQPRRIPLTPAFEMADPSTFKSFPVTPPFMSQSNSRFSYNQEQGHGVPAGTQATISSAINSLPSPYFAMHSPYIQTGYQSPDSSDFGEELGFYNSDPVNDFAFYDGAEYNLGNNLGEFVYPTSTVWI